MKFKMNKKLILIVLLLVISLGYAILSSNIQINGSSLLANNRWDIHFDNLNVTEGSVLIDSNDNTQSAATIDPNDNTKVNFNVVLNLPGDFYEFTVDVVNTGTVDGMVNLVTSNFKIGDGEWHEATSTNLPNYLKYRISYLDDTNIAPNHELKKGATETYKVRVEFIKDINPEELPDTIQEISFNVDADYTQTNENSKDREENPPFTTQINYKKITNFGDFKYDINKDKCLEVYQNEFDSSDLELYCNDEETSTERTIRYDLYDFQKVESLIDNDVIKIYTVQATFDINKDSCLNYLNNYVEWYDNPKDIELYCTGNYTSNGYSIMDNVSSPDTNYLDSFIEYGIIYNVSYEYKDWSPYVIITEYDDSYGTDVVIPKTINGAIVTGIGENVFKDKKITSVEFPSTIEYIGDDAFRNNQITKVTIPKKVKEVGANAFRDNNLSKVDIKNNKTNLNECSFGVKSNILNNNIPDTYTCTPENEKTQNSYTITFNKNNEDATGTMDNQTIKGDTNVSLSENEYQLEGYRFIEWNTESNGSGRSYLDKDNIKIAKNTTLYAQWAEIHTLTFNTNGGVLENTSKEILKGQPLGELPIPTKDDNNFAGWYTGLDTGEIVGENHIVQSDMTLYARWIDPHDTYDVTFDKNSEDAIGTMNTQNILEGTATTLTENAYSREGYSFVGWNTKADGTGKSYLDQDNITIIEDTTLYAEWVKIYTLTFDKNNNEAVGDNYSLNVLSGLPTTIPNEVFYMYTLEDKMIDRWNTSSDYTGLSYYANQNIIITRDTSLYAEWSDIKITPTIYWALQDNDSDEVNETLVISSYEVDGNLSGSFDGNKNFYKPEHIPWIQANEDEEEYSLSYDVTTVDIKGLVVPKYTEYWFYSVGSNESVEEFTADLENLDTKYVTDMSYMFYLTGENATTFNLDLSGIDTSNVKDMSWMFVGAGYHATNWSIGDISKWDVSKVIDMSYMFHAAGATIPNFNLDLSDWNVSNVIDMASMFENTGYNTTTFNLDLSNWNTSNVTNMDGMFWDAGHDSTTFNLDLTDWDTSQVTYMDFMFDDAGYNATTFSLDISNWNTSNVTNMGAMFNSTGYNATTFSLDISNWNTSNVTNMSYMFKSTGYNATTWSVGDLSEWDTSNVTDMDSMFNGAGYSATNFNLDLSEWDTSKVIDMHYMFHYAGYSAANFNLDLSDWNTSKVTNMQSMFYHAGYSVTTFSLDISNWNTSNVTDMSYMFNSTGYSATTFSLDISNWNTSNVTNMSYMFKSTGYNATTFNLDLSNWDTSKVTNMYGMFEATGYNATTWSIGNINKWDVSNVINISLMFNCAGQRATSFNLNLSNWDTSKVTDMWRVFSYAGYNATSFNLDISNWNMSNVISMDSTFTDAGRIAATFKLTIPKDNKNGINNTTSRMYGKTSSTYVSPPGGKQFTLAS